MNKLIVLTGPDGSGKTSILSKMQNQFSSTLICSIWDTLDGFTEFKKESVQKYLADISPVSRTLFLAHALQGSLDKALSQQKDILFDAYVYKYSITQMVMGDPLGAKIFLNFPKPDKVIYLDCAPETALMRKRKVGISEYEAGFDQKKAENFLKIQENSYQYWKELYNNNPEWIFVSDVMSLDEKMELIKNELEKILI